MPSAIASKTTKRTSLSTKRIKAVVQPCTGTLSGEDFDAIVKAHGGRAMTAAEKREFRRFRKDPYP